MTSWINLVNTIFSERGQSLKTGFAVFHSYELSRIDKYLMTESRLVVAWGWEGLRGMGREC